MGTSEAAQDISFAEMSRKQVELGQIVAADPDVDTVGMIGFQLSPQQLEFNKHRNDPRTPGAAALSRQPAQAAQRRGLG